jgi:prepilin-type N-terminal cleavage/methylation domain-containing protein
MNMAASPSRTQTIVASARRGFTLVELLIVIAAMAILAGIVIPQVSDSIDDANNSAMLANLYLMTSAIERYKIDHDGLAPDDLSGQTLAQLTSHTDADGNIGTGPDYPYGPYILHEIPDNPLNHTRAVQEVTGVPPADLDTRNGWLYYPPTGQVWAGERRTKG